MESLLLYIITVLVAVVGYFVHDQLQEFKALQKQVTTLHNKAMVEMVELERRVVTKIDSIDNAVFLKNKIRENESKIVELKKYLEKKIDDEMKVLHELKQMAHAKMKKNS